MQPSCCAYFSSGRLVIGAPDGRWHSHYPIGWWYNHPVDPPTHHTGPIGDKGRAIIAITILDATVVLVRDTGDVELWHELTRQSTIPFVTQHVRYASAYLARHLANCATLTRIANNDLPSDWKLPHIYALCENTNVILWTGRNLHHLKGHAGLVQHCAFFYQTYRMISVSNDTTGKVWDLTTCTCIKTYACASLPVTCDVSADDQWVAVVTTDHKIIIWDVATSTSLLTCLCTGGSMLTCSFSHAGPYFITVLTNGWFKIWDVCSGCVILSKKIPTPYTYLCNTDDGLIVATSRNNDCLVTYQPKCLTTSITMLILIIIYKDKLPDELWDLVGHELGLH